MRSFFSAIAAIAALLLAAVSVPAIWADRTVVNPDGFVAMAGPLGNDPQFQQALAAATARAVTSQLDAAPALQQLIAPAVQSATQNLAADPGFPAAWAETLRRSNELTVVDPAANANDTGALNLDVAPLLQLVIKKIGAGVGQEIPAPQQVLVSLGSPNQRTAIVRLSEVSSLGVWLAGGALLAFALALVIARRRSTTLALVGLGLAAIAGLWKLGLELLSKNVLDTAGGNAVADMFKQQYVSAAAASFNGWILITLIAAGGLVLIGLVSRAAGRRGSA
ncbi:MAG: hypothetical protein IIZ13_15990 [Renibacterium sp.]|nr:hypothetical protein [Renibacterium sp.]